MATLYTYAKSNIHKTWLLLTIFFVFIIFLGWIFSYLFNNQFFLIIAVFLSVFQSFFSYWYSDKVILRMTKAKEIKKEDNPEIYRLVENLCITAGLPLPRIYILNEVHPNAFTTGRNEKNAILVLTLGLLEKLNRVELEGVISHELSHIGNKDMLLQTIIVTLTGIISILSDFLLRISFWGGMDRDSENSSSVILFLLGIIAAILAPLAATLIQLAISRKREFLADASGALLTRYPEGLARALEKISEDETPLNVSNNTTAHLYIVNPLRGKEKKLWINRLFMTHPPVEERIKALRQMEI
ncbi:MAG TPA: M48 family metallopeptidase [Candidatus Pacearchaeota archaeon]|nr:M48 family metallopeptidase [Candidatus Pacearchaeota archaeon]